MVQVNFNGDWRLEARTLAEKREVVSKLISEGVKTQTLRYPTPRYKKQIHAGTKLQLWFGKRGLPKEEWLKIQDRFCTEKIPVGLKLSSGKLKILIGNLFTFNRLDRKYHNDFILADGFEGEKEFIKFFFPKQLSQDLFLLLINWDLPWAMRVKGFESNTKGTGYWRK